ncbi:cell division protein FtsA [Candidatus Sumerlaeota bacterium]|nr:cell division protein FtsA [Candidatus Sumerlaeota bacterium]
MAFGKTKNHRIITGLDIGTTKVCAIIGQADDEGNLSVLGMGSCPSKGLHNGQITEIGPTVDAIVRATEQAMEVANVPISEIYVGIAGDHIRSQNATAMVEIRHPMRGIDEKDRRRAIQKATEVSLPDDRALIHSIVQDFRVNGRRGIRNPVGLSASNLEVHTHLVMSGVDPINNIIRCIRRAGFRHPHVVLQSLASSMSVITPHERELGSVLIDIGGGTCDVAISADGAVQATVEIPVGGDRVTRDIAEVLNCSLSDAENVKKRTGCAWPELVERGRTFSLPVMGDYKRMQTFEETMLAEIVEARLEDLFQIVRRFIDSTEYKDRLYAGAILTGGSTLLQGITDVAERILEMKCRCGAPHGLKGFAPVVSSPIYATGVGLILYGMELDKQVNAQRRGMRRWIDYLVEMFVQ